MLRQILLLFLTLTAFMLSACEIDEINVLGKGKEEVTLWGGSSVDESLSGSAAENHSFQYAAIDGDIFFAQLPQSISLEPIEPVTLNIFSVNCEPGAVRRLSPEGTVEVSGSWASSKPLISISVNDRNASIWSNGTWSIQLPAKLGMNVYKIVAKNQAGEKLIKLCSVNAAEEVINGASKLHDSIILGLRNSAFWVGGSESTIESLGDVARHVLQSQELHETIHKALLDKDKIFSLKYRTLHYKSISYDTPEISVHPDENRLRVYVKLSNIRFHGRLHWHGPFGYENDRSALVWLEYIEFHPQINLNIKGGTVESSVELFKETKFGKIDVNIGELNNFNGGMDDFIESLISNFQGSIKNLLQDELKKYVDDGLADIIVKMVQDINKGGLSANTTLNVPNLTKPGSTKLVLSSSLSEFKLTDTRASLFSVSTKVSGTEPMTESDKILVPKNDLPAFFSESENDICGNMPNYFNVSQMKDWLACRAEFHRPAAGAVSYGLINQALSQLWKDGYFEVSDVLTKFGIPAGLGASLLLDFQSAPVAHLVVVEDMPALKISVGPVYADMMFPNIKEFGIKEFSGKGNLFIEFLVPFEVVNGKTINLKSPTIDTVVFDLFGDNAGSQVLIPLGVSLFIKSTLQGIMDKTLNGIKVLDVPSFKIPERGKSWGMPVGQVLSVQEATIDSSDSYLILKGTFQK